MSFGADPDGNAFIVHQRKKGTDRANGSVAYFRLRPSTSASPQGELKSEFDRNVFRRGPQRRHARQSSPRPRAQPGLRGIALTVGKPIKAARASVREAATCSSITLQALPARPVGRG